MVPPQGQRITARRRFAKCDGDSARAQPAAHLHQRSLRHRRARWRPGRVERVSPPPIPTRRRRDRPIPSAPLDNLAPGVNDDGSGTALTIELARDFQPERHRLRRDAGVHVPRRRGAGAGRRAAARAEGGRPRRFRSRRCSTTTSSATTRAATESSTARRFGFIPRDRRIRHHARWRASSSAGVACYVPSHKVRPMSRPDRFGRGGDHSAYNQLGFTAVGFRESRENFTRQHDVRDTFEGISLPYLAQNARVNAAAAAALALAPPPPAVTSRARPTDDHARAVRLRRQPEMDRVAGRGFLSHILA